MTVYNLFALANGDFEARSSGARREVGTTETIDNNQERPRSCLSPCSRRNNLQYSGKDVPQARELRGLPPKCPNHSRSSPLAKLVLVLPAD